MRRMIRCTECGKTYNYDEDPFCPHCGAFNQPGKASLTNSARNVERVDGINEAGHANSFVHQELHRENHQRRNTPLEETPKSLPRSSNVSESADGGKGSKGRQKNPAIQGVGLVFWMFFLIIMINLLLRSCAQ